MVLAEPGDALLIRSDVWHGGGTNRTRETRYVVESVYGRRKLAQKFFPYVTSDRAKPLIDPRTERAASDRQRRLLGVHPVSTYG